jgi:hypothetical protein
MKSGSLQLKFYDFIDDNHLWISVRRGRGRFRRRRFDESAGLINGHRERWQSDSRGHFHHQLRGTRLTAMKNGKEILRRTQDSIFQRHGGSAKNCPAKTGFTRNGRARSALCFFSKNREQLSRFSHCHSPHTRRSGGDNITPLLKGSGLQGLSGIALRRGNIIGR